jgi:hypothetical protein
LLLLLLPPVQWLQDRSAAELADLFETLRATNFRRLMAISVIQTQLPAAVNSGVVLRALGRLQVEDLERFASLNLHEDRYQGLTNTSLIELASAIYEFGKTQVCGKGKERAAKCLVWPDILHGSV